MLLYAATVFVSALLLFLVQPLIGKQILPWFGGTAGAWSVCLVFFQVALFAGYAYSHWTRRLLSSRAQAWTHGVLLGTSLLFLPIVASPGWKPTGTEDPTWRMLLVLVGTIGLPYFLLATTGPLIQSWFAEAFPARRVYRLFALSNVASLIALAAYPFGIEPWLATRAQAWLWSGGYLLFVALCLGTLAAHRKRGPVAPVPEDPMLEVVGTLPPPPRATVINKVLWLLLPAMSTWLLLAVTNHLQQNIASVPFLWLLPLTLYLLTFVICFDHDRWYHRGIFVLPAFALLVAATWGLSTLDITLNINKAIPLYALALLFACMLCHGELARLKPAAPELTSYYLLIALGGSLGGLFVGLVAPRVFQSTYELGIGMALTALLLAVAMRRVAFYTMPVLALGVAVACGYFSWQEIKERRTGAHLLARSFYGTLRTEDTGFEFQPDARRKLINGVIMHGEQYLSKDRRLEATSYYGPTSGIGLAFELLDAPNAHVGVIGLGSGSIAAYGRTGDTFTFYDLNPQVVDIAHREFSYLHDTAATPEVVLGDARISMERQPPQGFRLLVIDAFSSDSIPVHLLTLEAVATYLRHMAPGGVIAFHISNRFFDLGPVIQQVASAHGLEAALIIDTPNDPTLSKSDWMLVTRNHGFITDPRIAGIAEPTPENHKLRIWTDNYSNLFRILR